MSKLIKIILFLGVFASATSITLEANAQEHEPWTGAVAGSTIHFGTHDTLISIRRMINEGRTATAVRESKKFITRLSINSRSGKTTRYMYDGYNALCISLTSNKQFEEAAEACNTAIEMASNKWQAYNSRGSLNYKTEKYSKALEDYRTALEKAPDVGQIRKVVEHNIRISQARVSASQ